MSSAPSATVASFLTKVARRMRVANGLSLAHRAVVPVAVACLVCVGVGWLRPWRWPEPMAMVLAVAAIAGILVFVAARRISVDDAATTADHHLGAHDALSAAVQFADLREPFGDDIRRRGDEIAQRSTSADAVPFNFGSSRWVAAAMITILAVVLAFVASPQDEARAEADAARSAIEEEAARLTEIADEIASDPEITADEQALVEELRQLVEELAALDDLALAEELLRDQSSTLRAPRDFALESAVQGLDRSLAAEPLLEDLAGSATEQLQALAERAASLDEQSRQDLAERLDDLAATQAAGNAAAQTTLAEAAQALAAGDTAGAEQALANAAAAQREGSNTVQSGETRSGAANAAADGAQRLENQQSEGEGEGQGQGQGQGEGQGQGQGQGQG